MAGTLKRRRGLLMQRESIVRDLAIEHNKVVTDIEAVRGGAIQVVIVPIEDLSAGSDITARAFYKAPRAMTVLDSVRCLFGAASSGQDSGNSTVITLRNITEAANVASFTTTATTSANVAETLTLVTAAADIASGDVLGVIVTNGAAADTPAMWLQFEMQPQAIDAAGDMTAAQIGNDAGTAYTE